MQASIIALYALTFQGQNVQQKVIILHLTATAPVPDSLSPAESVANLHVEAGEGRVEGRYGKNAPLQVR